MNDTVYIPTPITQKPEKDGWYGRINSNATDMRPTEAYYYKNHWYSSIGDAFLDLFRDPSSLVGYDWLRPAKLSEVIGEAWDAGHQYSDWEIFPPTDRSEPPPPDKTQYINQVINKQ